MLAASFCARASGDDDRKQLLNSVRDFTSLSDLPREALFMLLRDASSLPSPENLAIDEPLPTYAQLLRQPREHRGRLVRFRGVVRRTVTHQAPHNDFSVRQYHEVWFFPTDAESNPCLAITNELPQAMPHGENIRESVDLVGTFLMLVKFEADIARAAPLVVAQRLHWRPSLKVHEARANFVLAAVFGLFCAAMIGLVVVRSWSRRVNARPGGAALPAAGVDHRIVQAMRKLDASTQSGSGAEADRMPWHVDSSGEPTEDTQQNTGPFSQMS